MRTSMVDDARERLQKGVELARSRGAQAARIHFSQRERTGCDFDAGRLKEVSSDQSVRFEVEVITDGRSGSAMGNDLRELEDIIDRALTLARAGSDAHFDAYPAAGELAEVKMHSNRTVELTRERMIEACQLYVNRMKDFDADLHVEAGCEKQETESVIVTSGGVCETLRGTRWRLGGHVQRTEGTSMLFVGSGRSWRDAGELFDPEFITAETLRDLQRGQSTAPSGEGRMTVLLPPSLTARLFKALEMGVNGRNVARGNSPLEGRIGEQVLDPSITLTDDPHADYADGATAVTSEGVPTRVTSIFENGVLRTFLYDLDSAGLAGDGTEPTGHDGCGPWSLTIPGGQKPSEQLLSETDDGLYIAQLLGFGQGNLINGDFSCNVGLGFRVKGGEIVGRVKDTMVAGNIYELLKSDVELSSDVEPTIRMPYLKVRGISVASSGE